MADDVTSQAELHHHQVDVAGATIHVVDGGAHDAPTVLFLHGWPEDWTVFERVMIPLSEAAHVVALDLPGIGGSVTPPRSNDKRTLAAYVHGAIEQLGLHDVTLVGHDVGGMVAYAYLHAYPGELTRAVIMNTAIPGVDPWSQIKRNPYIWHFAFHSIPALPEKLVEGRQRAYFDFFYDTISARPDALSDQARQRYVEAYARSEALHTGFEWYRAFPQDEKDNLSVKDVPVLTSVLYLRGERESVDMETYLKGLRDGGLRNVQGRGIPNSGHFAPAEQPAEVLAALRAFMGLGD
jgi:pimeloyl-ACP methyl ester carboxylesterase